MSASRISRRLVTMLGAAGLAVAVSGLALAQDEAPPIGNGKKQFAWAIGLNELPIIQAMQRRMTQQAAERGWEVLYDPGTGGNIQAMIPSIEAWITAGVPSITVTAFEPAAFEQLARRATQNGLIWLTYVQPTPTTYGTFGFGPCVQADLLVEKVVEHIKENDPEATVFISSNVANPAVACKWDGVAEAIRQQTGATVLPFQDANNEPDGLRVMSAVLQAHPGTSIAIGTNDDVARGMAAAFKAAGKDPATSFIAGFDGSEPNIREIKEGGGFIKLSIAISLIELADLIVEKNIELALGGPPQGDPQTFEVFPFAVMHGDPKADELLAQFELMK